MTFEFRFHNSWNSRVISKPASEMDDILVAHQEGLHVRAKITAVMRKMDPTFQENDLWLMTHREEE